MSKREYVIVSIMILVVLYGGFTLISGSTDPESDLDDAVSSEEALNQIITQVRSSLKDTELSKIETYKLKKAEDPWAADPFYTRTSMTASPEKEAEDEYAGNVQFSYTGYVEMGQTKMAIINGREYVEGEDLYTEGYYLNEVLPDRVVIIRKGRGEMGKETKITVPLEESSYFSFEM